MALDFLNPLFTEEVHIDLGTENVPANTGALSITSWVNPDADGTSDDQMILAKSDTTGNDAPFEFQIEEPLNELRGIINDDQLTGSILVAPTNWSFVAMVYDGADQTLFVNGVLDATQSNSSGDIDINTDPLIIAALDDGDIKRELNGLLEDLRVYTRALSLNEILTMFTLRGADKIINGLLWNWRMNERAPGQTATVAGSIIDLAGNLNGDPINAPVYQAGILN